MPSSRHLEPLYEFLLETLPSAITKIWLRWHLRRLYPDRAERKMMTQQQYVTLYDRYFTRVSSILPWVWALLFVAAIGVMILVTFSGE